MKILSYKEVNKNSLQGFVSVCLENFSGLCIYDISVFKKDNERWISFPSHSYEKDGKKKYLSYLRFDDVKIQKQFQDKLLADLDEYLAKSEQNKKTDNAQDSDGVPF